MSISEQIGKLLEIILHLSIEFMRSILYMIKSNKSKIVLDLNIHTLLIGHLSGGANALYTLDHIWFFSFNFEHRSVNVHE